MKDLAEVGWVSFHSTHQHLPSVSSHSTHPTPDDFSSWEPDAEGAALPFLAFHINAAAHQIEVFLDQGQAQAGVQAVAAARRIDPVEALENQRPRFRADADAGVG